MSDGWTIYAFRSTALSSDEEKKNQNGPVSYRCLVKRFRTTARFVSFRVFGPVLQRSSNREIETLPTHDQGIAVIPRASRRWRSSPVWSIPDGTAHESSPPPPYDRLCYTCAGPACAPGPDTKNIRVQTWRVMGPTGIREGLIVAGWRWWFLIMTIITVEDHSARPTRRMPERFM